VAPAAIAASLSAASSAASASAVANAFPKPILDTQLNGLSASSSASSKPFTAGQINPEPKVPLKIPAKLTAAAKGSSSVKHEAARPSTNSLVHAYSAKSISSSAAVAAKATPKNANAASIEKKTKSEADDDAENEAVSQDSQKDSGNTNHNRGHLDIVDGSMPMPPGGKHKRLDPNKSPGMPLDNKDSLCGRLMHYVTGGSHPTNMSGTHVPGIRMDGATEGEYPPGLFAQKGRAVKAFVNCFAGYFNTMGGSIPPCPGDCPPKSLNLNENSNKVNPLKKSAYEYPWSIRAGFLPENIEAFDLMEDPKSGKNKSANPQGKSNPAKSSVKAAPSDAGAPSAAPKKLDAEAASTPNQVQPQLAAEVNAVGAAALSAASKASLAGSHVDESATAAAAAEGQLLPEGKRSLWRELQQQRRSEKQLRQRRTTPDDADDERNANQNCALVEREARGDMDRAPSLTARLEGASDLVLQYRDQLQERLSRSSMNRTSSTNRLAGVHQDLRIRRNNSDTSYISGSKGVPLGNNGPSSSSSCALDPGAFAPSISPSSARRRPTDWIPAAASGML